MSDDISPERKLIKALHEGLITKAVPVEDGWDIKPQPVEVSNNPTTHRIEEKDANDVTQFG